MTEPAGVLRPVRQLWYCIEHLHAVLYFEPSCTAALAKAGLTDFWHGYFASRAAPLGTPGPGLVGALFYNFAPAMVKESVPRVWELVAPEELVWVRRRAAARVLTTWLTGIEKRANGVLDSLETSVQSAPAEGRPLFAANRDLDMGDGPAERLWQLCATLREHRGDGHVAVLTAHGLSGCEVHRIMAAETGAPMKMYLRTRGWSESAWAQAGTHLATRGLLEDDGRLSTSGIALRHEIEERTDDLAESAYEHLGPGGTSRLARALLPWAIEIASADIIRFPNALAMPRLPHTGLRRQVET